MTDPAIEAAQRAMPTFSSAAPNEEMVAAAREALTTIHEEIERLRTIWTKDTEEHKSVRLVLDRLSTFAYTSDEIGNTK